MDSPSFITINGHQFAHTKRNFTSTLFTSGPTASGYYKPNANGDIHLFDHQHNRIGGINFHGVLYRSSRTSDGRLRHQAAAPPLIGGLDAPWLRTHDEVWSIQRTIYGRRPNHA